MSVLIGPGNGPRGVGRVLRLAGVLALLLVSATAAGQGKRAWEEYDKLINNRKAVATLGPQLFGDAVDLYTGTLSFSTTDVSLPGNSALPVAVTRTYSPSNTGYNTTGGAIWGGDNAFADWELDVPSISGLFSSVIGWPDNRCDVAIPPQAPAAGENIGAMVDGMYYWKGNSARMPGGGDMLAIDAATPRPSTGGPYKWITPGRVVFSCLPTIQNGSGQGFLAVAPDGTKYWFDYKAVYSADDYIHTFPDQMNVYRAVMMEYSQ